MNCNPAWPRGWGSSWAWFCAQVQGVKVTNSSRASTKLQLSKGLCSVMRSGLKLNHGLGPWQGKWYFLEQDVIGRHWCVWQQRGQALLWAELLLQVSHHREESGLKCTDMAESIACAAPVSALTAANLIAPNLIAPQKWDREHSNTASEFPTPPESSGSLSPLASTSSRLYFERLVSLTTSGYSKGYITSAV